MTRLAEHAVCAAKTELFRADRRLYALHFSGLSLSQRQPHCVGDTLRREVGDDDRSAHGQSQTCTPHGTNPSAWGEEAC